MTGPERRHTEPEDGGKWTFPGAIEFDEDDGYWSVGICVTLTSPGAFPSNWFSFALYVSEDKGQTLAKVGSVGKPRIVDTKDSAQCALLYDEIVNDVMAFIEEPRRRLSAKKIGFETPSYLTGNGEKEA